MAQLPDHLGGFIKEGDPATWFPELWAWLVVELGVRSVLDIGCGTGRALKFFERLGCRVQGIEGVPMDDPRILEWDCTHEPFASQEEFDLVWSCEFVEHVEEAFVPNFLETIKLGRLLLMTHADPGQPGTHHVNCRPSGYWIEQVEKAGFALDGDLTVTARRLAFENDFWWRDGRCSETWWGFHTNHFARSGLAFRRR